MPRTGKQADELFASTKKPSGKRADTVEPTTPGASGRGRGRPASVRGETSPATVVLYHAQIVQLDEIANQVRARHRKVIKRADLIRGILSAVLASTIDLAAVTSEDDVRAAVAAQLKAAK